MKGARLRDLAVLVLGLAGSACGRGCTCIEGEKVFETIEGPVKVELVRDTHASSGRFPGPVSEFLLRIHYDPVVEVPVGCPHVDMAEDAAGKLVAWRCQGGAGARAYNLVRLPGDHRYYRDCGATELGEGAKPDFGATKPVAEAARRIFECNTERIDATTIGWLVDELRPGGDAKVGAFFTATAGTAPLLASDDEEPWIAALRALRPGERGAVEKGLCPSLADEKTDDSTYVHAARLCPLDGAGVGDAALAQLDAAMGFELAVTTPQRPLWVALVAARTRPKEAGSKACARLGKEDRAVAFTIVAATETRCAAAASIACTHLSECDGAVCSADDMRWRSRAWLALVGGDAARIRPAIPWVFPDARLAAAWVQGPLPADALARRGRLLYAFDAGSGPGCQERTLDAGAPCQCDAVPGPDALCNVGMDAGRLDFLQCRLRIDDHARTITVAGRACDAVGQPCGSGSCCGGADCVMGKCEPEGASATATATASASASASASAR